MESGLRAATAQLKNRQRWFKLRLLSLLQGDQAREIVGAQTALGRRLTNTLAYVRRTESTVLLEEPKTLDAELLQEETEKARPGLTIFTDGPRPDDVATGYAVVWKNGQSWGASKRTWATTRRPTMQSAPPSHGAGGRIEKTIPERVTIFTDAQGAIKRMASEELGPGQKMRSRRGSTSRS